MLPSALRAFRHDPLDQGPIPAQEIVASNLVIMGSRRVRIAVVDDEETVRRALHRLFTAANCEGLSFGTGAEFLEALPTSAPDCVVLDLQMPGMTGLEVLERLSAAGSHLPTLIITAHDESGSREQCLAAGAVAYLRKPLDGQVLLENIFAALALTPEMSVSAHEKKSERI